MFISANIYIIVINIFFASNIVLGFAHSLNTFIVYLFEYLFGQICLMWSPNGSAVTFSNVLIHPFLRMSHVQSMHGTITYPKLKNIRDTN